MPGGGAISDKSGGGASTGSAPAGEGRSPCARAGLAPPNATSSVTSAPARGCARNRYILLPCAPEGGWGSGEPQPPITRSGNPLQVRAHRRRSRRARPAERDPARGVAAIARRQVVIVAELARLELPVATARGRDASQALPGRDLATQR